jgi:hypothetical protein
VGNPSGFSEALSIKRGGAVLLVDPPPHYLAKALWRRAPLFGLQRPAALAAILASRWEWSLFRTMKAELDRSLRQAGSFSGKDPIL